MSMLTTHSFVGTRISVRPRPISRRIKTRVITNVCSTTREFHRSQSFRALPSSCHHSPLRKFVIDRVSVDLDLVLQDALEPIMSAQTFEFHWGKHHRAYVDNLNKQIAGTEMESMSLEDIIVKSWNGGKPTPVFNNAAQAWNHDFFWNCMKPGGGGQPSGKLMDAIKRDFKSFDEFKKQFKVAGATQFGSGWAWLVSDSKGKLSIVKTANAENHISGNAGTALLTMDVWEHAYYLDVQNRRPAYIDTFVDNLINWDAVAARYT